MLDDALVLISNKSEWSMGVEGLNPCCAGRCSSTQVKKSLRVLLVCLNPCCAGRCSSTKMKMEMRTKQITVSILVVLDDALVPDT